MNTEEKYWREAADASDVYHLTSCLIALLFMGLFELTGGLTLGLAAYSVFNGYLIPFIFGNLVRFWRQIHE